MLNSVGVQNSNNRLSLLCINDTHGNIDNFGGLLAAARRMDTLSRSPNVDTLKISGGDNWAGGNVKKNAFVSSFLEYIGVDVSAVGNHELDDGVKAFSDKLSTSKTKFLASNIEISPDNPLYGKIQKSEIKVVNGTKYGIVGAVTPELLSVVTEKDIAKGISVQDEQKTISSIQAEVAKLREQGVNRVLLTSHCGLEFDKKIAQSVSGIDVIVSGHSHDVTQGIKPGENYFNSPAGEPVLIVQTGENARNYGMVDLEFDQGGKIVKATNTIEANASNQNLLVTHLKDSVLGVSPIVANIAEIQPLKGNRRIEPSGWANLMCDSMRSSLKVDIAFMNAANLRKVPLSGRLTERDIEETSPMKNKLLTTQMSEVEVVNALKNASSCLSSPDGYPGLLQVSGLKYKIDSSGKLLSAAFIEKAGNTTPIDIQNPSQQKLYTVAYDSFMEDGREYPDFRLNGKAAKWYEFDKDKTLKDYILKMPQDVKDNLKVIEDGRIEIVQTSKPQLSSSSMQNFLALTLPKSA